MPKYLNLGCGRTHFPGERPAHHAFVPEDIYGYDWVNIDRSPNVGADKEFDLFTYPWPLESDSYDVALLSHLCEHIPHEIKIDIGNEKVGVALSATKIEIRPYELVVQREHTIKLSQLQDGWFAFFAELYRVLTHDARVHILAPHASSDGAVNDPTHIRYLTPSSFEHSMRPDPDAPFEYQTGGIHFEFDDEPKCMLTEWGSAYSNNPPMLYQALMTQRNIVTDFYVRLKVVK